MKHNYILKLYAKFVIAYFTIFIINLLFSTQAYSVTPLQQFTDEVLVPFPKTAAQTEQAVVTQNQQNIPHITILQRDETWKNATELTPFMFSLMTNQCAYELSRLVDRYRFIVEAFVMDNKGALVCLTSKTSDYWQGDEDKFIDSFAEGIGAVYYGDKGFDQSSHELSVQISVPIMLQQQAIGVITFTIGLDSWELR